MAVGAISGNTMPMNYGGVEKKTNHNVDQLVEDLQKIDTREMGQLKSRVLGIMAIPVSSRESIGVGAYYSNDSTEEDPIITVSGDGIKYNIHVNEVDPTNATEIEMFALSCYLDDQGITDRGTFGSFNKLRNALINAPGYLDLADPAQVGKRINWLDMLREATDKLLGTPQTYAQGVEDRTFAEKLEEWKEKVVDKILNGETEEKIQIGAQALTESEWDEMIEEYDKAQEELREAMREEIKERNMQVEESEERIEISEEESAVRTEMLTSESLTAEDDNHELHIIWTTDEGIFCRKAGQTEGYAWSIPFTEAGQRDMVKNLMNRLPKERTGLATDVSIWERYLKGELSMDEILEEIES